MATKNTASQLILDPSGGIAGDMFSSALISAGANTDIMIKHMSLAATKLGAGDIHLKETPDHSQQLQISLEANHNHLSASRAHTILQELFKELDTSTAYQQLGIEILDVLIDAEEKAHSETDYFKHLQHHSTGHHHNEPQLHEAQDIIIDIMGAVTGMQLLNLSPQIQLTGPVSVGGGTVTFSHGTLPIPAPATAIILQKFAIPWQKGPIKKELCTPTGASILAAMKPTITNKPGDNLIIGRARGSQILAIPPLTVYIN